MSASFLAEPLAPVAVLAALSSVGLMLFLIWASGWARGYDRGHADACASAGRAVAASRGRLVAGLRAFSGEVGAGSPQKMRRLKEAATRSCAPAPGDAR